MFAGHPREPENEISGILQGLRVRNGFFYWRDLL